MKKILIITLALAVLVIACTQSPVKQTLPAQTATSELGITAQEVSVPASTQDLQPAQVDALDSDMQAIDNAFS